jgi:hypothetical protein
LRHIENPPTDMTDFPTARTMLPQDSWLCLSVRCHACLHRGPADLRVIIDAGRDRTSIPEFREQYARARAHQAEYFLEEIPLIADDGRNDFMEKQRRDGTTFLDANREHLERSKIRISARRGRRAVAARRPESRRRLG